MMQTPKISASEVSAKKDRSLRSMPMLTVGMNTRCNQRCAYCPPMGESYMCSPGDLQPEIAKEVLDLAISRGVRVVRFSGGEPTLHPRFADFLSMMRRAKIAGTIVHLNTNGVLLGRYLPLIDNESVSSLRVSLDSLHPKKYGEITGTHVLHVLLNNIKAARAKNLRVDLIMVAMRANLAEVDDLIQFCAIHGIGLKLSDLERHDYDQQGLWEEQFVSLKSISNLLKKRAAKVLAITPEGDFGMAMTDYWVEGVQVRVKDSFVSAVYTDYCRSSCPIFPCPEGVYSLLLKPDATLSWCKRNLAVGVPLLPGKIEDAFERCVGELRSCARQNQLEFRTMELPANHWLQRQAEEASGVKHDASSYSGDKGWRYFGNQKSYGRDR